MFKKIITLILLVSLIGVSVSGPAEAGLFFKKKKEVKTQAQEKSQKTDEKKILVAQIYASWCPGCKNIQPTLDQLIKEVPDINFIKLDVSTPSKALASAKLAKELKITDFYNANKSKTATVAVIIPSTGEILSVLENDNEIENYKEAVEKAKTKEKSLENPPA